MLSKFGIESSELDGNSPLPPNALDTPTAETEDFISEISAPVTTDNEFTSTLEPSNYIPESVSSDPFGASAFGFNGTAEISTNSSIANDPFGAGSFSAETNKEPLPSGTSDDGFGDAFGGGTESFGTNHTFQVTNSSGFDDQFGT